MPEERRQKLHETARASYYNHEECLEVSVDGKSPFDNDSESDDNDNDDENYNENNKQQHLSDCFAYSCYK